MSVAEWMSTLAVAAAAVACGGGGSGGEDTAVPSQPGGGAAAPTLQTLNSGLDRPWGLAQLPDGRLLVTQKGGAIVRLSAAGRTEATLSGVPPVLDSGQGGLLGIAIDPDFGTAGSNWVYFAYAEAGSGSEAGKAGTTVARGRLEGDALTGVQVIFRQAPKVDGSGHYGSRLVFARDKTLYITTGERMTCSRRWAR